MGKSKSVVLTSETLKYLLKYDATDCSCAVKGIRSKLY